MPVEQSYPSPSAAQVSGGAGPFFSHNGGQSVPPPIPNDLQQLQAAESPRVGPQGGGIGSNGAPDYSLHAGAHVAEDALRQAASQETLAQHVMNMTGDDQPFHTPENADPSSRKRSKVSRACDECRRKKIRCDALEASSDPCSNCQRTQARCQFSRTPMKRGPSKGYIKELADKINTLESRLGPSYSGSGDQSYYQFHSDLGPDAMDQRMDQAPQAQMSRKRTHSVSERSGIMYGDHPYAPARTTSGNWSADAQRHLPNSLGNPQTPTPDASRTQFSPRSGPFRFTGPEGGTRESISMSYETERDAAAAALVELDDGVVDEYYRIIHQTFPLLPHSKTRLRARLANCPTMLRDAFLMALDCAVRSSPSSILPAGADLRQATKRASELISASQYENSSTRNLSQNLIYIQTLVLMALESDNHGPATMRGQVGPPRAEWLGRAIGMATHLKLNVARVRDRYAEGDPDAEEKIGRRVWWILFILDRWHACSTSCLLQLPDSSSTLTVEDQVLLGENTYHLARLSYIMGHLSTILQEPPSLMAPSSAAGPIISTAILGEIDRFRESVETLLLGPPTLVHLCYFHVRLLVHRLAPAAAPRDLLVPAVRVAAILNTAGTSPASPAAVSPLAHHFAALAALTLVELLATPSGAIVDDDTRADAEKGLADVADALDARRGSLRDDPAGWDAAIRDLVAARRLPSFGSGSSVDGERDPTGAAASATSASVGLQHLADAAIGGNNNSNTNNSGKPEESPASTTSKQKEGSTGAGTGAAFDPAALTRSGYLAALAQEKSR